jgi:hypothetical protein
MMTRKDAIQIIGRSNVLYAHNLAIALTFQSWDNTEADWRRLHAACVVLGRRAPQRAMRVLMGHYGKGKV